MNDSRIHRIRNEKFSGYYFYVHYISFLWDLQICISVPLISFLRLFTETIAPERKSGKIDEIREELWRNHQNRTFSRRNVLLRYDPCIKNKELHDKEQ